jgi:hypothetical protein
VSLQTRYDFTLPRGYVDEQGAVHRTGTMRLATARDELEPLRDPTIDGADDPRLTVVVLARVVEKLGTLELVTTREIEGLFAADLAFLQDFYGVINFGSQAEYEELLAAQRDAGAPVTTSVVAPGPSAAPVDPPQETSGTSAAATVTYSRPGRSAIEEIPHDGR